MQVGQSVSEVSKRWAVVEKMNLVTQYAFAGDYTGTYECALLRPNSELNDPSLSVEALEKATTEVSKFDGGRPPFLEHPVSSRR